MEHRNGRRAPIAIPVELLRGNKNYGSYMSNNIGHGGLLLDCRGILKKGDVLTAKIANNSGPAHYRHQLKVMVVHTSEHGAGLMWADYNISFFNQLEIMLSAAA